jgi:proteasome lid subunit RPN8/RPN11
METLEGTVDLKANCYYNMLRSVIETFPRESTGDLIGKKNRDYFTMSNAYPIQTSQRKPTQVTYGNNQARKRLINFNHAVDLGGLWPRVIGGYHSHPNGIMAKLGDSDLEFIQEEMEMLKRKYWIEIILLIKSIDYSRPREIGEFLREQNSHLKLVMVDTPNHAYHITLFTYKVDEKNVAKKLALTKN